MAADPYLRRVLTVIASALVYLCFVLTPWPAALALQPGQQPGVPSGPAEVVIVGLEPGLPALPVRLDAPVRMQEPVRVTGFVQTDPGTLPVRAVVVGWEESADPSLLDRPGAFRPIETAAGLPTTSRP
jgi:hypothetical protein